jgi:hypothetical protein
VLKHRSAASMAIALLVVFLGAACAGTVATQTSAPRYVSAVCGAVRLWKDVIEVRSSSLVSGGSSAQVATDYFNGVLRDTNTMVTRVEAFGAPALANGGALRSAVVRRARAARSALVQSAEDARLAADDQAAAVREVELSVSSEVSALRSRIRNSSDLQLARAAKADLDCRMLFNKAPVSLGA